MVARFFYEITSTHIKILSLSLTKHLALNHQILFKKYPFFSKNLRKTQYFSKRLIAD